MSGFTPSFGFDHLRNSFADAGTQGSSLVYLVCILIPIDKKDLDQDAMKQCCGSVYSIYGSGSGSSTLTIYGSVNNIGTDPTGSGCGSDRRFLQDIKNV